VGEGVGDCEGVAVDFGEVAAFDVFLEREGFYDGLCGGGFGSVGAGGVGGFEF
jgi:hypothetical protein